MDAMYCVISRLSHQVLTNCIQLLNKRAYKYGEVGLKLRVDPVNDLGDGGDGERAVV